MLSRLHTRTRPLALLAPLVLSGCLAGPSTALGGGPIGMAPDLKATALLPEPDSTRGVGFIIRSNRRDLLEESRVELNAAARSFERLLGQRPDDADIRLTADERQVQVSIGIRASQVASFIVPLERGGGGRARIPEAVRVASTVVLVMSREWLSQVMHDLVPGDTSRAGWLARERIPSWLRVGLLQNVAVSPVHEFWLAQLGRQRDSLPTVAELFRPDACDAACLAPFVHVGTSGVTRSDSALAFGGAFPAAEGVRAGRGRGRFPMLAGRTRLVASTYALLQFIAKREGADYLRRLVITAETGGDVTAALGSARSFTADPGDIDRQWRVWLATYAFPDGR